MSTSRTPTSSPTSMNAKAPEFRPSTPPEGKKDEKGVQRKMRSRGSRHGPKNRNRARTSSVENGSKEQAGSKNKGKQNVRRQNQKRAQKHGGDGSKKEQGEQKQSSTSQGQNSTGEKAGSTTKVKQNGLPPNEERAQHQDGHRSKQGKEEQKLASTNESHSRQKQKKNKDKKKSQNQKYLPYHDYNDCLARYAAKDPSLIRGRVRALAQKDGAAFVTCDRGKLKVDAVLESSSNRNRALDGDTVFVELLPEDDKENKASSCVQSLTNKTEKLSLKDGQGSREETWQDDAVQRRLWNPSVRVRKAAPRTDNQDGEEEQQRKGQVVYVVPPRSTGGSQPSELNPSDESFLSRAPRRAIVGTLRKKNAIYLMTPNNKSLPEFFCRGSIDHGQGNHDTKALYKAEYVYGSWRETDIWPPCENVQRMGTSCNVEDETMALLTEHGVNHGDFSSDVFKDVDMAVESGMILPETGSTKTEHDNLGWKPTPDMYKGRRDYRKQRIFTIDPTTAKDLDDALHITQLPDGRVEIGVHIADVSYFVQPDSAVDEEAKRRATTVYLVDRTVPMLPRPLCEVACSLNENVERLAFSCVWRMNMDGTLGSQGKDEVWYGRTVIKSCARLDYATAQNIIENKVATGESQKDLDETLWPRSRRPTGGHTIDQVAADVRIMNRIAQARRRLRFQNGALALNGIKLAFQLEDDGETPKLCAPYPIQDSNRLVEEYMLLANFLVAQRLITHAGGLALLRQHPPPLPKGLDSVVSVAKEGMGYDIDSNSSQALQESLSKLGRECQDELVLQCVTEMLMTPMQPAEYIAAGVVSEECWRHFALNIPYYTHFTSPIRRYPDVLVHRLLQATIDGEETVESFPLDQREIHAVSAHCNEKRMASKKAQERSDRVFLALYLRKKPLKCQLAVVLSVGQKTFTVFIPSLGLSTLVFADEHKDRLTFEPYTVREDRRIRVTKKNESEGSNGGEPWSTLEIKVFTKVSVTCSCKEKPPIDVKARLEGPWTGE